MTSQELPKWLRKPVSLSVKGPGRYAIGYFILLLVFAAMYSCSLESFYAPNAALEPEIQDLRYHLEDELTSALRLRLEDVRGDDRIKIKNVFLYNNENLYLTADVTLELPSEEAEAQPYGSWSFTVSLWFPGLSQYYAGTRPPEQKEVESYVVPTNEYYRTTEEEGKFIEHVLDDIFPHTRSRKMRLNPEWMKGAFDLWMALNGVPTAESGAFLRGLYISTVTITTLGLGDVVPISQKMRLLVCLESLLGIVMMGLFISSVGKPRTRK